MKEESLALIYGVIIMLLMLSFNILLVKTFDSDIYILFFCDIIALLAAIWYKLMR